MLEELLDWCKVILIGNDFIAVLEESPAELWEKAPTSNDIEQLEVTILFWCFYVKYWQEERDGDVTTPSKTAGVPLARLETQLGIEAHDLLFKWQSSSSATSLLPVTAKSDPSRCSSDRHLN